MNYSDYAWQESRTAPGTWGRGRHWAAPKRWWQQKEEATAHLELWNWYISIHKTITKMEKLTLMEWAERDSHLNRGYSRGDTWTARQGHPTFKGALSVLLRLVEGTQQLAQHRVLTIHWQYHPQEGLRISGPGKRLLAICKRLYAQHQRFAISEKLRGRNESCYWKKSQYNLWHKHHPCNCKHL